MTTAGCDAVNGEGVDNIYGWYNGRNFSARPASPMGQPSTHSAFRGPDPEQNIEIPVT
jgi:hypothetical protein